MLPAFRQADFERETELSLTSKMKEQCYPAVVVVVMTTRNIFMAQSSLPMIRGRRLKFDLTGKFPSYHFFEYFTDRFISGII